MTVPVYSVGVRIVTVSIGLLDALDLAAASGMLARVVDLDDRRRSVRVHAVLHRRRGGDEAQVELALEALADDLHVQQAEEAAPEAEAERARRLGLVGERRVVEAQLLERLAQVGELVAVDRVEPAEHHRLRVAVALERPAPAGRRSVTVSPERASPTSLMPAMR